MYRNNRFQRKICIQHSQSFLKINDYLSDIQNSFFPICRNCIATSNATFYKSSWNQRSGLLNYSKFNKVFSPLPSWFFDKSVNGAKDLHSQIFLLAFLHLASATSLCIELNKRDLLSSGASAGRGHKTLKTPEFGL